MLARALVLSILFASMACAPSTPTPPEPARLPQTAGKPSTRVDDPELDAAIQKARATLDEFIRRQQNPARTETFSVEGEISMPDGSHRHIWLGDVIYSGDKFKGTVITKLPASAPTEYGKSFTIARKDVTDWMILSSGKSEGGFTVDILLKREGQAR